MFICDLMNDESFMSIINYVLRARSSKRFCSLRIVENAVRKTFQLRDIGLNAVLHLPIGNSQLTGRLTTFRTAGVESSRFRFQFNRLGSSQPISER